MKHPGEASWIDFAKNLASPKSRVEIQAHLDQGCAKCRSELELWRNIQALTQAEPQFSPPRDIVRIAKSKFAAISTLENGRVRLLFDSLLQPQFAGVRGSVSSRQLLFETPELSIDLRLEPHKETGRTSLIGQVLSRPSAKCSAKNLPVRIHKRNLPVFETATNELGEFQLDFEAGSELCISIGRFEDRPIVLPLFNPHKDTSEATDYA